MKCYNFKIEVVADLNGYVWANNEQEAIELILTKHWDEIEKMKVRQVEEIRELKEEDEVYYE